MGFCNWGLVIGFILRHTAKSDLPGLALNRERSEAMTVYDATMTKIRQLPEPLVEEVSDFVDFLLLRQDSARWQLWNQFTETMEFAEAGFSDYLPNLEDYENRLARGEIQW